MNMGPPEYDKDNVAHFEASFIDIEQIQRVLKVVTCVLCIIVVILVFRM